MPFIKCESHRIKIIPHLASCACVGSGCVVIDNILNDIGHIIWLEIIGSSESTFLLVLLLLKLVAQLRWKLGFMLNFLRLAREGIFALDIKASASLSVDWGRSGVFVWAKLLPVFIFIACSVEIVRSSDVFWQISEDIIEFDKTFVRWVEWIWEILDWRLIGVCLESVRFPDVIRLRMSIPNYWTSRSPVGSWWRISWIRRFYKLQFSIFILFCLHFIAAWWFWTPSALVLGIVDYRFTVYRIVIIPSCRIQNCRQTFILISLQKWGNIYWILLIYCTQMIWIMHGLVKLGLIVVIPLALRLLIWSTWRPIASIIVSSFPLTLKWIVKFVVSTSWSPSNGMLFLLRLRHSSWGPHQWNFILRFSILSFINCESWQQPLCGSIHCTLNWRHKLRRMSWFKTVLWRGSTLSLRAPNTKIFSLAGFSSRRLWGPVVPGRGRWLSHGTWGRSWKRSLKWAISRESFDSWFWEWESQEIVDFFQRE